MRRSMPYRVFAWRHTPDDLLRWRSEQDAEPMAKASMPSATHPATRKEKIMLKRPWLWGAIGLAVAWALALWPIDAQAQTGSVKLEWFSWSIFRLTSPTGKVV